MLKGSEMQRRSKIECVAFIVAFILAALAVLSALLDRVILLAIALVPLISGIGIMRRQIWSAYGFSLLLCANLLIVPLLLFRAATPATDFLTVVPAIVLAVILIPLFFLAGRSLATSGGKRGWAVPWILLSVLASVPAIFVRAFSNPTGSMEDTLLVGDYVLVRVFPKPTPKVGAILVFAYPPDRRQTFMKRVVGMPGDRIRIAHKALYRNGSLMQESYARHKTDYLDSYRDDFPGAPNIRLYESGQDMLDHHVTSGEVVVPGGKYFVLGDNRDSSLDSRYWGFVDAHDIIGTPVLIYDSEELSTDEVASRKVFRPHNTRWGRIGMLL